MTTNSKANLIARLERLRLRGKGARLTAEELVLLFAKPEDLATPSPRADEASPLKPIVISNEQKVQIRWLIRRDMPDVVWIETHSFDRPWCEEDFLCCLRQRNAIGMVAEHDSKILGFMIYELHESQLHVLNFAVAPEVRRQSVGSQMVGRLIDKLSQQRRNEIILEVRESNLDAQLFFRAMGFQAESVLPNYYEDAGEDAYQFRFLLPTHPENEVSR